MGHARHEVKYLTSKDSVTWRIVTKVDQTPIADGTAGSREEAQEQVKQALARYNSRRRRLAKKDKGNTCA